MYYLITERWQPVMTRKSKQARRLLPHLWSGAKPPWSGAKPPTSSSLIPTFLSHTPLNPSSYSQSPLPRTLLTEARPSSITHHVFPGPTLDLDRWLQWLLANPLSPSQSKTFRHLRCWPWLITHLIMESNSFSNKHGWSSGNQRVRRKPLTMSSSLAQTGFVCCNYDSGMGNQELKMRVSNSAHDKHQLRIKYHILPCVDARHSAHDKQWTQVLMCPDPIL